MERKMIREGKEESIIERLEEYILPVYPEWKERRVPASEEKIAEWNKKCGKLLPEAYLQYLKYMGEGDGEFLLNSLQAETKLSEMMKWYEGEEINLQRIEFAILDIGCGEGWYIVTKENGKQVIETEIGSIHSDSEEEDYVEYAESFEKMLCQEAYFLYEPKYYKYRGSIPISANLRKNCLKNMI